MIYRALLPRAWLKIRNTIFWIARSRPATIGTVIVVITLLVALFGPSISPHNYWQQDLDARLQPPVWMDGGNWRFILGTDELGRCVFTRIIYGTRVALIIGGTVTILAASLGVILGLIAGYFGGFADSIIMRIVDVQWSFPYLLLALAVMAMLGTSIVNLLLVMTLVNWVSYARTIRGIVASLKTEEFVTAAKSIGATSIRIMFKHILPNTVPEILVLASFNLANIVLMEAALSFLGLGVQAPVPSWGAMISDSRAYLYSFWWLPTFPGLALAFLVLGVNQLGDGLRDLLDPRLKGVI